MRTIDTAANGAFLATTRLGDPGSQLGGAPLPTLYEVALEAGWVELDGCWFLEHFRRDFHAPTHQFTDRTGIEAAANGRGIPDLDVRRGPDAAQILADRGLTFARRALELLPDQAPTVTAWISVGPTLYDPAVTTGTVTFTAEHAGEIPYLEDIDEFRDGIVALRSSPHGNG